VYAYTIPQLFRPLDIAVNGNWIRVNGQKLPAKIYCHSFGFNNVVDTTAPVCTEQHRRPISK